MANEDPPWDDFRTVLAIARAGSLSGAARALGVNHSTVFRRLQTLEARLDSRLFERGRRGYAPTAAGEDIVAVAERLESDIVALTRRLAGQDRRLTGTLRLTAPDDIAEVLLIEPLARFRRTYPGLRLELVVDNRALNLTRREADLAVRATRAPPETLIGRRIGPVASAIYAAPELAKGLPPSPDLSALTWVTWDEGLGPAALANWQRQTVPAEAVGYRANSLLHLAAAVGAGIGVGVLPCFLGDPDLVRIAPPDPILETELWLLSHPDLRRNARVRALSEFLFAELRSRAAALKGE
jgi:DNA-binding transcriptional LysR family regulator